MSDRRLPIYILVDVSGSMEGYPIYTIKNCIWQLIDALICDPKARDTVWISLIPFGDEARQVVPLVPLDEFAIPEFTTGGISAFGSAFSLLCDCCEMELVSNSDNRMGDYRPCVCLFSDEDGFSSEELENAGNIVLQRRWNFLSTCIVPGGFSSCNKEKIRVRSFSHAGHVAEKITEEEFEETDDVAKFLIRELLRPHGCYPRHSAPFWFIRKLQKECLMPMTAVTNNKRIPVYFLLDTSDEMESAVLSSFPDRFKNFLDDVWVSEEISDILLSSFITFNEEARQIWPLDKWLPRWPTFIQGERSNKSEACRFLSQCMVAEVRAEEHYLPLAIIITGGLDKKIAITDLQQGIVSLRSHEWHRIVICVAGNALPNHDSVLWLTSSGADAVILLDDLRNVFNDLLDEEPLAINRSKAIHS